MDKNIFRDFENNRQYTMERLDGISSAVVLFMVSDEIKFLHFNLAADKLFGYEKGGLSALTQKDALSIFHPDYVDRLYSEIIATMRDGKLFNYDCRILCRDGSYQWTKLSAQLARQREGGRLYFHGVLTPIPAPLDSILKGCHYLIAAGEAADRGVLLGLIEQMGGTCDITDNGLDALDLFTGSGQQDYRGIFIGSRLSVLNGFELAKDIRHCDHPSGACIPLILLVSASDHETVQAARDIGIDTFLKKPLDQEEVSGLLKALKQPAHSSPTAAR